MGPQYGCHQLAGSEVAVKIADSEQGHCLAGPGSCAADAREQHDVVQAQEIGRHMRFIDKHIQPCPGKSTAGHQLHQCVLIYDAAARNVDQVALRAQGFQDGTVDEMRVVWSPVVATTRMSTDSASSTGDPA